MNAPYIINYEQRSTASTQMVAGQPCSVVSNKVVAQQNSEQWLLEDGQIACRAFSCLIHPEVSDQVLVATNDKGALIISILAREECAKSEQGAAGTLSLPNEASMTIRGGNLTLSATSDLAIESLKNIDIKTPFGKVQVLAESLIHSVFGTFVSLAKSHLLKTTDYELKAEGTIVATGEIQVLTAKSDIVMDASRINMG